MKALCLAALLGNLAFFAWSHWLAPVAAPSGRVAANAVPRLVLANENDMKAPSSAEGAPIAAAQSNQVAAAAIRCASIGPFSDLPDATQAAVTLRSLGFEPRTRAVDAEVLAGLWVYIENLSNRADAQRAMAVLKAHDIDDATVMDAKAAGLNISLGVFSEAQRAQQRAAEVRALGFTPTIAERTRPGTLYWLDSDLKSSDAGPDPEVLQGGAGRIIRLEVQACPEKTPEPAAG